MPDLRPHAAAVGDGDVFIQTGSEEIRFAVIAAPFVGHAVNSAERVTNQQAGFEPAFSAGDFVGDEREMFDKDRAGRERPFSSCRKSRFVRQECRARRYSEPQTSAFSRPHRTRAACSRYTESMSRRHPMAGVLVNAPVCESNKGREPANVCGMLKNAGAAASTGQTVRLAGAGIDRDIHRR